MGMWRREDGRWYCAQIDRDLFGLVVVIAHGGRHRPPRIWSVPIESMEEGERIIARIEARRRQHGYVRQDSV